ncbi:MAG: SDR family NAD(P)-dependent oxidoreductase, partial [Gemmatimonadetes bacterium]|nr:SDR family NAD(P)-dependent oxidoreductase [Gemmatimonadota bacterium]
MSRFEGRSVIVTGGAKGIGAAICTAFAEEGARVMCADVDVVAGEALASAPTAAGEIH